MATVEAAAVVLEEEKLGPKAAQKYQTAAFATAAHLFKNAGMEERVRVEHLPAGGAREAWPPRRRVSHRAWCVCAHSRSSRERDQVESLCFLTCDKVSLLRFSTVLRMMRVRSAHK